MKKLYFFLLFISFILFSGVSFGQCSGTTSKIVTADFYVCTGDSLPAGGAISNGNTGWRFRIFVNDTSFSNKVSDNSFVMLPPFVTGLIILVADSGGCILMDTLSFQMLPKPVVGISPPQNICVGNCVQLTASGGVLYTWSPCTPFPNCAIPNPVACPTVSTTYSVTVTDANGCSGTASTSVGVNPIPTLGPLPNVDICFGWVAQLTCGGFGGPGYNWVPPDDLSDPTICNPIAIPSVTTAYTLIAVDANGCISSGVVIVTVHPLPPIPVLYCSGDTLCVVPNPNYPYYQWYYNGLPIVGATDRCLIRTITGNYSIDVIDSFGCARNATTACFIGLEEPGDRNLFSIYPNPNNGDFFIEVNRDYEDVTAEIFDVMGKRYVLTPESFPSGKGKWHYHIGTGAGIYLLRVSEGEKIYTKKIIVE